MPYDVNIGDGADALGQNQLTDALDGTYWVSGWDATLGTGDLEVDIAAGTGAINGGDVSTGSTQTVDFTADVDGTEPRKAVISVDDTGTVQKTIGETAPATPSGEVRFRTFDPAPPATAPGVVVAEVWLDAGVTSLNSDDVRDRRVANTPASRPSLALLTQPVSEDSTSNLDPVSYDFTPNSEDVYLNELAVTLSDFGPYTIEIEKNSTVVASKEISPQSTDVDQIVKFTRSDYSELLSPGDTGTVSVTGGRVNAGPSGSSYTGVLVDISNQAIQAADFNGYATLFARVLDV